MRWNDAVDDVVRLLRVWAINSCTIVNSLYTLYVLNLIYSTVNHSSVCFVTFHTLHFTFHFFNVRRTELRDRSSDGCCTGSIECMEQNRMVSYMNEHFIYIYCIYKMNDIFL